MFKSVESGLRVLVASMVLASTISCSASVSPAVEIERPRELVVATTWTPTPDDSPATQSEAGDSSATQADHGERASAEPQETKRVLRRIKGSELNKALVAKASQIIHEHHSEPFGTEIPFEIDGQEYVGKIERHYHPEGGELRPWGYHPGCSLFVVESAS